MPDMPPPPIVTQEIRIVDAEGHPRIVLSAKDGNATIMLVRRDGTTGATVRLDQADRPAVQLSNPDPAGPTAAFEVDDKGAHVKFDRPGGASSYLFLNNAGISGVVLIDADGKRRSSAIIAADGSLSIERPADAGGKSVKP